MSDRCGDDEFDDLMARLRSGDDDAAAAIFRRFVDRLVALAASRFEGWMRDRADVEGVVLSACKSFFLRDRRGDFDLGGWDDLWALLSFITVRKCGRRRRSLQAARRDERRIVGRIEGDGRLAWLPDRTPTPEEAAVLAETVERLFRGMSPADRPIVEQVLAGYTAAEIARRADCSERTVRRVRDRARLRLRRLIDAAAEEVA